MTKTPGEIAKEAYQKEFRKSQSWEAAAAAVIDLDCNANDPSEHLRSLMCQADNGVKGAPVSSPSAPPQSGSSGEA